MTSGARDQHRRRRVPRALRWLLRLPERRHRRRQARIDQAFWGLVNDHNWLQYPYFPKERR